MANIVFMGTPDFARESLKALVEKGHNIIAVVTKVDSKQGRGMKLTFSPVKEYAIEKGLNIMQPEKIKGNDEFLEKLKKLEPDFLCVVAYGKILPKEVLDTPKYGAINVHGSLLPKYRGASPIQWAILNGDKKTGITTMYMDEGMDTGDIILKEEVDIEENETLGELWNKMSIVGANLLVKTLEKIENKTADRIQQEGKESIAPLLSKEMAKIDFETMDTQKIHNLIRGLNPIMGAYTYFNGKKLKIWRSEIIKDSGIYKEAKPGDFVLMDAKKGLYIKTIDGIISALEVQPENSRKMSFSDFLRGLH